MRSGDLIDPKALSMQRRYEKKCAVIFGGARGIGRATAERLPREGARILIDDILQAEGAAAAHAIGDITPGCAFIATDVGDPAQIEAAIGVAMDRFGRIDTVFYNVGIGSSTRPRRRLSSHAA